MNELDEYLDFAKGLAEDAGQIMTKYFQAESLGLEVKSDNTPVTLADTEINQLVIAKVKETYPSHGVIGEEDGFGAGSGSVWVVDPLDGTYNFSRKIPLYAFSMALVTKGRLQVGVVYDPMTDRLWYAAAGKGAYENGKKLDIYRKKPPVHLLISSWVVGDIENSIFKDRHVHGEVANLYALKGNITEIDIPVAYALAAVGAEILDGFVSTVRTPWDVAAGSLIALEAGAKVTDLFGQPIKDWTKYANGILAASPDIHKYLLDTIMPALEKRQER